MSIDRWVGSRWRTKLWPLGLLYSALATLAVFTSSWGSYVGDNRFEQYANPARRLALSFGAWDPTRGLGAAREDVWLGTTIPVALFRSLGMSPWAAERAFHALCLVTMGLGVVALLRVFRTVIGPEHLLAGLYAMFGPYAATFLVPTNLWYNVALAPWLLVTMIRGVTSDQPWRWAAIFALLVAWAGNPDLPGLASVALVMVVALAYLLLVRATRWRDVWRWLLRAGLLSLLCSAWALSKTLAASQVLSARLLSTELPETGAATSSWSESIRGLGNWLSYLRWRGVVLKPQGEAYFTNSVVVIATFVAPVAALATLWLVRWRPKVMFATMAIVSLIGVVGGFGGKQVSPVGAALLSAMDSVSLATAFRNTYKLGAGLAIGVSVLAAVGVVRSRQVLRERHSRLQRLPALLAAAVLVIVSFPFWTGTLYHPTAQFDAVPGYWTQTFDYLDRLPPGGRTAIVPAVSRADYRWGWIGDDIFDALLARPHAVATGVPRSSPVGQSALEAFTMAAQSPLYAPGVLGPMARRLGITEIIVRNDLKWESLGLARPTAFDGLRSDTDFTLAATFGAKGESVVAPGANDPTSNAERSLHPVEVYRLADPTAAVRTVPTSSAVLVSGDPSSWPQLIGAGLVNPDEPIVHSGTVLPDHRLSTLSSSRGTVVTDSARRRLRTLRAYEPSYSITLGENQEVDRPVGSVFPGSEGALSTVWYPDATEISAIGTSLGINTITPSNRPANAFDGDPATAWALNLIPAGTQPGVRVVFNKPTTIAGISLQALLSTSDAPTVTEALLVLSDGSTVPIAIDGNGSFETTLDVKVVTSLDLLITGVDPTAPRFGLTDVEFPGVDLREFVQAPHDLSVWAQDSTTIAAQFEQTPAAFSFARLVRSTNQVVQALADPAFDDETFIRRKFDVLRPDDYNMWGTASLPSTADPALVDDLLGQPVTASADPGTSTTGVGLPVAAADGDLTTAWVSGTSKTESLTVQFPRQMVRTIELTAESLGPDRTVTLAVGGTITTVKLPRPADCATKAIDRPECRRSIRVALPRPIDTDTIRLHFSGATFPLRVDEVLVNDGGSTERPTVVNGEAVLDAGCHDLGIRIGKTPDADQSMLVRLGGTAGDLLAGRSLDFTGCAVAAMPLGAMYVDTNSGHWVDGVSFATADWAASNRAFAAPVAAEFSGTGEVHAQVNVDGRTTVVLSQSFDPRWSLSVDDATAAPSSDTDAMNSWVVNGRGTLDLIFRFRAEKRVAWAVILSLASILGCLALVVRRRASPALLGLPQLEALPSSNDAVLVSRPRRRTMLITTVVATVIGVGIAGWWSIATGAVVAAFVVLLPDDSATLVGFAMTALLAEAAIASALLVSDQNPVTTFYSRDRPLPNQFALAAVLLAIHSIGRLVVEARAAAAARSGARVGATLLSRTRAALARWSAAIRHHVLVIGVIAVGVVIRAITFDDPSNRLQPLVQNLRLGSNYTLGATRGPTAVDLPPLVPSLLAFVRLPPVVWSVVAFAITAALSVSLARRLSLKPPGWIVAAACVLMPFTWGMSLQSQLAALGVTAAAWLFTNERTTVVGSAGAGLCLALAACAQPDVAVLVPLLGVAWWVTGRRAHAVTSCVTAWVMLSTWSHAVWGAGYAPWLASSFRAMVADESALSTGVIAGSVFVVLSGVVAAPWLVRSVRSHRLTNEAVLSTVLVVSALAGLVAFGDRDPVAWATPQLALLLALTVTQLSRRTESDGD